MERVTLWPLYSVRGTRKAVTQSAAQLTVGDVRARGKVQTWPAIRRQLEVPKGADELRRRRKPWADRAAKAEPWAAATRCCAACPGCGAEERA